MGYRPNLYGTIRDRCHPSEIAAERPALATRIHENAYDPIVADVDGQQSSIRGSEEESPCAKFNDALRRGAHGDR